MSTITATTVNATTLKATTLQTSSAGPVALTKQQAAIVLFGMNTHTSSVYFGIGNNQVSSRNLNISSGADGGTGRINGNLTSNLASTDSIYLSGTIAANNVTTIDAGATTTSAIKNQMHDADTSTIRDMMGFMSVFGDLA